MIGGVITEHIELRGLGREMFRARRSSIPSRSVVATFAELGDWTAVAFELIQQDAPRGALSQEEREVAVRAARAGAFRKATPYFKELLDA